jgi:hypothetical protein
MSAFTEAYDWRGRKVVDRDGETVGKLNEIYLDRETNRPEWALVNTGLLGTKSSFVPLKGAAPAGEDVRVVYTKDQIKDAPSIDADGELSQQEEAELYRHYGLEYSEVGSGGGLPEETSPATSRVTADRATARLPGRGGAGRDGRLARVTDSFGPKGAERCRENERHRLAGRGARRGPPARRSRAGVRPWRSHAGCVEPAGATSRRRARVRARRSSPWPPASAPLAPLPSNGAAEARSRRPGTPRLPSPLARPRPRPRRPLRPARRRPARAGRSRTAGDHERTPRRRCEWLR